MTFRRDPRQPVAQRRLAFRQLRQSISYHALGTASDAAERASEPALVQACANAGPIIGSDKPGAYRPGFFRVDCNWPRCDTDRVAAVAAAAVRSAHRRFAEPGFVTCTHHAEGRSESCADASGRVATALRTGFRQLTIAQCRNRGSAVCVTSALGPEQGGGELHAGVEITLANRISPGTLHPGQVDVTGLSIDLVIPAVP